MALIDLLERIEKNTTPRKATLTEDRDPVPVSFPYVSTSLEIIQSEENNSHPYILSGNKTYYRLSPCYYAWLDHQMVIAHRVHKTGKVSNSVLQILTSRFNRVIHLAHTHFHSNELYKAVLTFDPR